MLLKLLSGDLEALANDALGEFCRRSRPGVRFRVRLADREPVMPTPQVTLRTSRPVFVRLERAALA